MHFLKDEIGFLAMSDLLADCMQNGTFLSNPSLEDYIETDQVTREMARVWVNKQNK